MQCELALDGRSLAEFFDGTRHSKEMNGGEFFVDHPRLHRFIAAATEIVRESTDAKAKLKRLREPYAELLGDPEWLPDEFKQPSASTTMGNGIASWLLYRSELKNWGGREYLYPAIAI